MRPDSSERSAPRRPGTPESDETEGARAAAAAGLVYVSDDEPGITRARKGTGFAYSYPDGTAVRDYWERQRIRKLAVPPAYEHVWICPDSNGHIQATGRDARGRKQYRYHPRWNEVRDSNKYEHIVDFCRLLPRIRARVSRDMRRHGLPRERVLATIIDLLETTLIRIGNEDYAQENQSYGLTTLRTRHVAVDGGAVRFHFKGKSGKVWRLAVRDRRIIRVIKACQDLPGQHLFQYVDDAGERQAVTSSDVNTYLREITGQDVTAKDFRTWAGTVLAAIALSEFESFDTAARAKKNIRDAIEHVAARLGNTPTICRKCYVHPEILGACLDGNLLADIKKAVDTELQANPSKLKPQEAAVLGLLHRRLGKDLKRPKRKARAA